MKDICTIEGQAKQFGEMMEHTVSAIREDTINDKKATLALLDEKRARLLVEKYEELHRLMEELEEQSLRDNNIKELKSYTFIGAISEYDCKYYREEGSRDLEENIIDFTCKDARGTEKIKISKDDVELVDGKIVIKNVEILEAIQAKECDFLSAN